MEQNKGNEQKGFEDIYSSTPPKEYVDIVSSSDMSPNDVKKGKKRFFLCAWWKNLKKWKKAIFISVTSLVLVFCIIVGAGAIYLNNFLKDFNHDDEFPAEHEDLGSVGTIDEKVLNIALFGIDTRSKNSFTGLSDSIMILSLNFETGKVKIISVMRDSLVPITQNGKTTYAKINSAYSKGGPELAVKTLNTIFKLDITEYATVNFYGMAEIIDAVGGIDVTLTDAEVAPAKNSKGNINTSINEICNLSGLDPKKYYVLKSGKQHLNGIQAVAYSRIRYVKNIWGTSNDYGRTDRQRYVMQQLFNKALSLKTSQYPSFAKKLFPYVKTSLSVSEVVSIALKVFGNSPTFEQYRVPMNEKGMNFVMSSPSGNFGSVVYYDLDYVSRVIRAVIYDNLTIEEFVKDNPVEKNDWYRKLFPQSSGTTSSNTTSSKPESSTPESSTPESSTPESSTPQSSAPENNTPETSTPDTSGSESGEGVTTQPQGAQGE